MVGTAQLPTFVVSGTITVEADGTTSRLYLLKLFHFNVSVGSSDFTSMQQISFTNDNANPVTEIRVITLNDEVTLEYEDRVTLRFTPAQANFIENLADQFEYIRDTANINIIDKDSK